LGFEFTLIITLLFTTACSNESDAVLDGVFWPTQESLTGNVVLDDTWTTVQTPVSCRTCKIDCYTANHGQDVYIAMENGVIVRADKEYDRVNELKTYKGRIVGTDEGEWGGAIEFSPDFGSGYTMLESNFKGFYIVDGRIFVLTGLAHLISDFGYLYELTYVDGKWKAEPILNLDSAPNAYMVIDETLYLVTNKAVLVIENGEITKSISGDDSWWALYPNSLVVVGSDLYMGLRHGMFHVDLESGDITKYFQIND